MPHPDTRVIKYSKYGYIALETGCIGSSNIIIVLGGLTDGAMSFTYSSKIEPDNWSVIHPVLRSSYLMFGLYRLTHDMSDLSALIKVLNQERKIENILLIGSSTGCQISTLYCTHGEYAHQVTGVVLQAPVSDRECMMLSETKEFIEAKIAESRILIQQDKAKSIVYQTFFSAPVSARRFLDLYSFKGLDDMFSTDFTDSYLIKNLNKIMNGRHVIVTISLQDQYVAKGTYPAHGHRIMDAITANHNFQNGFKCEDDNCCKVHSLLLELDTDHQISDEDNQSIFLSKIVELTKLIVDHKKSS